MSETSSLILLLVLVAAIAVSLLSIVMNLYLAQTFNELSNWSGWVVGLFVRMFSLGLAASAKLIIVAKFPLMQAIVEHSLILFAVVVMLGMVVDVYISLQGIRKSDLKQAKNLEGALL